jgi:hypothetical protein
MILPSTDAALLADMDADALAAECLRRWRLYLDGGRTDAQFQALRWVCVECQERGMAGAFNAAERQARGERNAALWEQWRTGEALRERTPRRDQP